MPIPLDHGRPERPPAGGPPRQAPAGKPALSRVPLAAGRRYRSGQDPSVSGLLRSVLRAARRPPRALPLAIWLLGAMVISWLAGCAPSAHATAGAGDPLAALAAPDQSPILDLAFWVQEQATRSLLWRRAFAFCRFHPTLPNCRTVRMASWWGSPPPATASPIAATSPPASASTGTAAPPLVSAAVNPGAAKPPTISPGASAAPAPPPRRQPAARTAAGAAPPPTRSPERRHS
jgi:hypothetical protein